MIFETSFYFWIENMKSLSKNDARAKKIVNDYNNLTISQFRKKYNMRYY